MNIHIRTLISVVVVMTITLLSAEEIQAGGNVTVTGSYEYYLPPDVSEKVGRTRALEQARLQALANAFGTFLSSTTAMNQREDSSGAAESINVFSTADVAGVWVKTIEERVERRVVGDDIVLEAYVKGQARAREISAVEFDAEVGRVDDSERFIPASRFKDRERFDIRFVTPEAGYVAIYASDGVNDACRLLPRRRMLRVATRCRNSTTSLANSVPVRWWCTWMHVSPVRRVVAISCLPTVPELISFAHR